MFLTLLLVTFLIALSVSFLVAWLFRRPVLQILGRLVPEDLTGAWHRYLTFAVYVVGISAGVRIWSLEQYILPRGHDQPALLLTSDRWTFEVFPPLARWLGAGFSERRAGRGRTGPEELDVR